MSNIIYIAIGFLLGVVFAKWRFDSQIREKQGRGRRAESGVGSNATNEHRAQEHQKHLDRILGSFGADDEITNDKVEHLLGVSNTTAERYLDQLEKAGKLKQIGKTGQGVTYNKV